MPRRQERTVHRVAWGIVAAHRVDGNPDHLRAVGGTVRRCLTDVSENSRRRHHAGTLLLFHRSRLAAPIISAIRADTMRQFLFVTVRALAEARGVQRVVGPPLRRPRLGMSPFRIWHYESFFNAFSTRPTRRYRSPFLSPPNVSSTGATISYTSSLLRSASRG